MKQFGSLLAGVCLLALTTCGANPTQVSIQANAEVSSLFVDRAFDYAAAAQYSAARGQDALLIMQAGEIVLEEYQNGYGVDVPHRLNSGSKSFSCTIAVAAQDQGLFELQQPASTILTAWQNTPKQSITIEQLLNFTSGLPGTFVSPRTTEDVYTQALTTPLKNPPGQAYTYGALHLGAFAALIQTVTGQDPVAYLQEQVLNPIGVEIADWDRDPLGQPLMASGAYMTARHWAQFGQLLLQNGHWDRDGDGQMDEPPILNPSRLEDCHRQGSSAFAGYGLTFWLNQPGVRATYDRRNEFVPREIFENGDQLAPNAPSNLYAAIGASNQILYILPTQQLVVARFGRRSEWNHDEFLQRLLGGANHAD